VIVNNFNVNGIGLRPAETDPPLVIDPNAVLPQPIATQGLETVSGNRTQVGELSGGMNVVQLPFCRRSDTLELPAEFASKNLPSFFIPEGPDHHYRILPCGV
jgi:hypothetical protein